MKFSIKQLIVGVAVLVGIGGILWMSTPSEAACNTRFNIVACGTPTHQALKNEYANNSEIRAIYTHFGITQSMINGANMYEGIVNANNNTITLTNGNVAATNAHTIQRNHGNAKQPEGYISIAGTGRSFPSYPTSNSYVTKVHSAFVWLDSKGKFIAAVDKSCGNPVWGTPTYKEAKNIEVCDLTTGNIVTIREDQYNSNRYSKNVNDCKKIQVCELSTGNIVTIKEKEYNTSKHSKNLSDCEKIQVCELETNQIITIKQKDYNSQKHSKDVNDCKKIQVCELSSSTIVTIKENEYDESKHSKNLSDCEKIQVCELETGKIVTIKQSDYSESKHSKDLSDCENVQVCRISDKKIVTIARKDMSSDYTDDMSKCQETPEVPTTPVTELPRTGVGEGIVSVLGLGSLTAAGAAYLNSRRRA